MLHAIQALVGLRSVRIHRGADLRVVVHLAFQRGRSCILHHLGANLPRLAVYHGNYRRLARRPTSKIHPLPRAVHVSVRKDRLYYFAAP